MLKMNLPATCSGTSPQLQFDFVGYQHTFYTLCVKLYKFAPCAFFCFSVPDCSNTSLEAIIELLLGSADDSGFLIWIPAHVIKAIESFCPLPSFHHSECDLIFSLWAISTSQGMD